MSRATPGLARAYDRLRDNAGLTLLKADHMPVIAAVLGENTWVRQRFRVRVLDPALAQF